MKKVLCLLGILDLAISLLAQTVPSGLRTDLIERTDVVYSGGYPTGLTVLEAGMAKGECQYAAIATPRPRFSWVVPSAQLSVTGDGQIRTLDKDVMQSACQIRVYRYDPMRAKAPAKGAKQYDYPMPEASRTLVWDSGRMESARSSAVVYGGPALQPDTVYGWEVRTWVTAGRSEPFESGWNAVDLSKDVDVVVEELGDSSVDLAVKIYILVSQKAAYVAKAKEVIYEALGRNGIQIPFPQRDIHIFSEH